jgi:hypothetical protein
MHLGGFIGWYLLKGKDLKLIVNGVNLSGLGWSGSYGLGTDTVKAASRRRTP